MFNESESSSYESHSCSSEDQKDEDSGKCKKLTTIKILKMKDKVDQIDCGTHGIDSKQDTYPLHMTFVTKNESYDDCIQKFWGKMTELITGPEHEYLYLKKTIQRIKMAI